MNEKDSGNNIPREMKEPSEDHSRSVDLDDPDILEVRFKLTRRLNNEILGLIDRFLIENGAPATHLKQEDGSIEIIHWNWIGD